MTTTYPQVQDGDVVDVAMADELLESDGGGGGGGGSGATTSFVYNADVAPSGNTFASWELLAAAVAQVAGPKRIAYVGNQTVPANSTLALGGAVFTMIVGPDGQRGVLTFSEGATLTGMGTLLADRYAILHSMSTEPVVVSDQAPCLGFGSGICAGAGAPFALTTGDDPNALFLEEARLWTKSTIAEGLGLTVGGVDGPCWEIDDPDCDMQVFMLQGDSMCLPGSIKSAGDLFVKRNASGKFYDQPLVTGSIVDQMLDDSANIKGERYADSWLDFRTIPDEAKVPIVTLGAPAPVMDAAMFGFQVAVILGAKHTPDPGGSPVATTIAIEAPSTFDVDGGGFTAIFGGWINGTGSNTGAFLSFNITNNMFGAVADAEFRPNGSSTIVSLNVLGTAKTITWPAPLVDGDALRIERVSASRVCVRINGLVVLTANTIATNWSTTFYAALGLSAAAAAAWRPSVSRLALSSHHHIDWDLIDSSAIVEAASNLLANRTFTSSEDDDETETTIVSTDEVVALDATDASIDVDPSNMLVGQEVRIDRIDADAGKTVTIVATVSGETDPTIVPGGSLTLYRGPEGFRGH